MRTTLTLIPAADNTLDTLPRTDPATRIVTFTARPSQRAWAAGQDLLSAIGVRLDLIGSGRSHDEDLEIVHAWLTAWNIELVIVRHADNFTGPRNKVLAALAQLCDQVGADLALTCDDVVGEDFLDTAARLNVEMRSLPALRRHIRTVQRAAATPTKRTTLGNPSRRRTTRPVQPNPADADFPIHLPRTDFPLFRSACRDTLTAAQFRLVDQLYTQARDATATAHLTTAEQAVDHIAALVATKLSSSQARVIALGAQAGAFMTGYLLKINLDVFTTTIDQDRNRRMTSAEVRSLIAYRQPWRSAATALYDADMCFNDIRGLTVGDVQPGGDVPSTPLPLHPDALVFLRAQAALRRTLGATAKAPLIDIPSYTLSLGVRRVATDLDLPGSNRRLESGVRRSRHWRYQLGVTLKPLTGTFGRPFKPGAIGEHTTVPSPRPHRKAAS